MQLSLSLPLSLSYSTLSLPLPFLCNSPTSPFSRPFVLTSTSFSSTVAAMFSKCARGHIRMPFPSHVHIPLHRSLATNPSNRFFLFFSFFLGLAAPWNSSEMQILPRTLEGVSRPPRARRCVERTFIPRTLAHPYRKAGGLGRFVARERAPHFHSSPKRAPIFSIFSPPPIRNHG